METIKTKVILGLPLTEKEKALYLLFIATSKEAKTFTKTNKIRSKLCK